MRIVYFFVNGIATWPGCAKNWNKRAAVWLTLEKPACHGLLDEYFTTALTVWIHERERAEAFAALLDQFYGWRIIVVAHSNGCHVTLDALRIAHSVPVHALHLVAGAVNGNFERNGLNWMLEKGQVQDVRVYRGGKDYAMRLCSTLAGRALFGIYPADRPLGLTGPVNVNPALAHRVLDYIQSDYGHSTWWHPKKFDQTMKLFRC